MYNKTFHNSNGTYYTTVFLIILAMLVFSTGCQETEPSITANLTTATSFSPTIILKSTTTPTLANTPVSIALTPTNIPLNTPTPSNTLEPTVIFLPSQEEWIKYENNIYGFSFTYPKDWTLVELPNKVVLTYPGLSLSLRILVKQNTENTQIIRSGVSAGDLIMRGKVTFLEQELIKNVLVYQGKAKAVLYNNAGEIEVSELVFAISLESNRSDYESITIPTDIQEQADKILESFELTR